MEAFYIIIHIILTGALLVVIGVRPAHTRLSKFELSRRAKSDDKEAQKLLRRESLIGDIYSLQRVVAAILLVAISLIGVLAYHWLLGLIIALIIALESGAVARISLIQRQSQKLYEIIEPALLRFTEKFPNFLRLIRTVSPATEDTVLDSKEELKHLVSQSGTILSDDERNMILTSLKFDNRLVKEVMTPRAVVDVIKKSEILGPVVLSDLHKTGHSRIPVIDKDIDHIIGILYVQDLLTIDGSKRHSRTAEKAMNEKVFYVKETQTLSQALAAFLRTHHHLFIVVNEFRETVGVLSLEDVIEALIGRRILDEFDAHDDLRAVALRNPNANNHPAKHEDI